MKKLVLILALVLVNKTQAQDINYAKQVVNTLAAADMKGRGYVQDGNKKAAEYISAEFARLKLKSFTKNYYQPLTMPVNTFPEQVEVTLNDGKVLKPGIDFLVDAGSPAISGSYSTVHLTSADLLREDRYIPKIKSAAGKVLVVDAYDKSEFDKDGLKKIQELIDFLKYSKQNPATATIILTYEKLTWEASTVVHPKPSITIKTDSLSAEIHTVKLNIKNKFIKSYPSQNIVGYIEGKNTDSLMVFVAHYDHLGMMGPNAIFYGANDNASGVAMLLNLAQYYSQHQPNYTMVFIAFTGEELGLLGAQYFTEHPLFELKRIKFLINFDLAGTGDEGIQVVNGTIHKQKFDKLVKINEEQKLLAQVKIRGEACNSDHCMFHFKKVPCFFIYTLGGIKAYHDIDDKAETLPLTEFEDYFKLMIRFVDEL